jgi:hypothetical protein
MLTCRIPPAPTCATTSSGARRWLADGATLPSRITAQYLASLRYLMQDLGVGERMLFAHDLIALTAAD